MQRAFILAVAAGLIVYAMRKSRRNAVGRPGWYQQLSGGQKIFGLVALVIALLIVLNPEFMALGLLGDTAFFDMLVLALSVQMHGWVVGMFRRIRTVFMNVMRWLRIPSPGLLYLLAVVTVLAHDIGTALQKTWQRIIS